MSQPPRSGWGGLPAACVGPLEDQEKQLDDFAQKYGEVRRQLDQCRRDTRQPPPIGQAEGNDATGVARERDRLRDENINLRRDLEVAQNRVRELEANQDWRAMAALPCVAITVDDLEGKKIVRAAIAAADDEAQIRNRFRTLKGAEIEIRRIPYGRGACLYSAGAFVLAAERSAGDAKGPLEQVYNRDSSALFRLVEDSIISFAQCAEAAAALREAGVLPDPVQMDLTLWAMGEKVLGQCRENRRAPLDRQWTWQGGRLDDRSGMLVLDLFPRQR